MRKALFAMILVGAAFAGGAAVNGPGMDWLKATIRARLQPNTLSTAPPTPAVPKEVPSAPLPSLLTELQRENRVGPTPTSSPPAESPSRAIEVAPPPPKSETAPVELAGPSTSPTPGPAPTPALIEPSTTSDPDVAPASRQIGPVRDWADLRRRMRELGVSRYEIDGEPGGRCRFRCLIPLAGRRAVGQQFEGEGDDDFQAADAALRRVALWRASETAPP